MQIGTKVQYKDVCTKRTYVGTVTDGPVWFTAAPYCYTPEPQWMARLWTPWPRDQDLVAGYVVQFDEPVTDVFGGVHSSMILSRGVLVAL